jgi:aspartate aminotransferase
MGLRSVLAKRNIQDMTSGSWIRQMFEEGIKLKRKVGEDNVFDFSLGNPSFDPPPALQKKLEELVRDPGKHGYMQNAGFLDVRLRIAEHLSNRHRVAAPLTANHIVMTSGAGGALNVIFETILNPGDEVIVPKPFFVEYQYYVHRHQGKLVLVPTREDFQLDLEKMEQAVTPQTKAILINSPNNPSGAVYSEESLRALAALIDKKEKEYGRDIILVTDEPYAGLVYDGAVVPPTLQIFPHSILATSNSKDLGLAGERIGFLAISPLNGNPGALFDGLVFCNRILGFINAPALMQRLVAEAQGEVVGLAEYQARRDLLYGALTAMGYSVVKPQGTFYLFPKSPIPDDVSFARAAQDHYLLVVPGTGFGAPGHFRLSYSSISQEQIRRSLPAFRALAEQYGLVTT